MKRGQVAALAFGAALGLTGVTVAVVLSRKEGREAARTLLGKTSTVAEQARKSGERVAKIAVEQYQAQAPRAIEALNSVMTQAPQTAEALSAKLPKFGLNGKHETAETTA